MIPLLFGFRITIIPFLLFLIAPFAYGQSALDGFDPNANGPVSVVVVQPDGKILIGGSFTTVAPNGGASVSRNNIARLNPDGTLDTAFNPNANSFVYAIALQADGKILVGGSFHSIGGQTRTRIARLDPITGLADSFDPSANNTVNGIAVRSDGKILVVGEFSGKDSIGGKARNRIARLDPVTGLADGFDPDADDTINAIALQPNGNILLGGAFHNIGGQMRNRIARIDRATGLADSFNPNASGNVFAIAVQADGKILAAGAFHGENSIGGQKRNLIARLDPTTGLADAFSPGLIGPDVSAVAIQPDGKILIGGFFNIPGYPRCNNIARFDPVTGLPDSFQPIANGNVLSIAVQSDGKILVGGYFNGANSIGGQARNHIARLERDGLVDQTLNLSGDGNTVGTTAIQPDGKILIVGSFTNLAGVPRNGFARLNRDGTLDVTFDPRLEYPPSVSSIIIQPDGKILIGGGFTRVADVPRKGIARLNQDGSLDMTFDVNPNGDTSSVSIETIVVQIDGKLLVGGIFQKLGGQSRSNIARMDPATGLVDSFDPSANHWVHTLAVQSDGKILVGGNFTKIGGQARYRVARLDPVTGLADSLEPNPFGGEIDAIAVQQDGKILVGGYLGAIGGQTRWGLARLDSTSGLPDRFDPRTQPTNSIALQADGNVLASGAFTTASGQTRNHIARLDRTTGFPDSFDPNPNGEVFSSLMQPDGKVLTAGNFTSIGGQARIAFARLSNGVAALQDLEVTQSTVRWTLKGSSPQLIRVTFEISDDGIRYVLLGNGTPSGNEWGLSGLNLPTGTNLYVRARGCYRTGVFNASESILESVRNVFLAPTPAPCPACARVR